MRIWLDAAKELEANKIIQFKGSTGKVTTAEIAVQAPQHCTMHSMAGLVYDLDFDNDQFILTEVITYTKRCTRCERDYETDKPYSQICPRCELTSGPKNHLAIDMDKPRRSRKSLFL